MTCSSWYRAWRRPVGTLLLLLSAGCSLPWDPAGTLERVKGGVLHVGVSHNPPWTRIDKTYEPAGKEADLVRRLARGLNAKIEWRTGGETHLMKELEHFKLDLVIGGITTDTPWKGRVGLTRPHSRTRHADFVFACPPGENGWIVYLDRWLSRQQTASASEESQP